MPLARSVASVCGGGAGEMQVEEIGAKSQFILHGREMSRMLQDRDGLQSRTDRGRVRRLLHSSVPTYRRKSPIDGRMFIQKEGSLSGSASRRDVNSRRKRKKRRMQTWRGLFFRYLMNCLSLFMDKSHYGFIV